MRLFFWTVELVLTIVGVYFILQMPNIFSPILKMLSAIFLPLLVAGFIYYMFDPIVVFLEKHRIPRVLGFLLTFLVVIILVVLAVMNVVPQLVEQTIQLTQSLPIYADETSKWLNELAQRVDIKFIDALSHFFPKAIRKELRQTVELNETLSAYISSTILDALIIGVMSFLAMRIFNQPYSLLLAVICGITNIIPYVGPFIGAVPAIIVGLFISPFQALYMALSILVIQQLDGNLIKPLLFGKSMNIHPLTIILVLIGAGSVAGILGMLICIPVYAVIKTIILNIRKIYLLRKMEHVSEKLDSPKLLEETSE